MAVWNPVPYVQHAWCRMQTVYGKIALLLFYSYIWCCIVGALFTMIFPRTALHLIECLDGDASTLVMIRELTFLLIGFLLYADMGCLTIQNVAMVTIFMTGCSVFFATLDCGMAGMSWFDPVWLVATLILTILDDKLIAVRTKKIPA